MLLLLGLLALQAVARILNAPAFVWNEIRMARSVGLLYGVPLYPDRNASTPIVGTMHTPVSHCLYLAVAALRSPTQLLLAGSLLSLLLMFVPLAWVLWRASDGAFERILAAGVAFLFCGFSIMEAPGTFHLASMIHVDAAVVAFATIACGIFSNPRRPVTSAQVWICGLACAFAVGSKQTAAPIVLGVAVFIAVIAGRRMLAHFCAAVLMGGAILFAIILLFVPLEAFLFNTVTLAAHRPLKPDYADVLVRAFREEKQDAAPALFTIVLITGVQWMMRGRPHSPRKFFAANRWLAFAIPAAMLLPVTVKGFASVGADVNHPGLILYLLFVAAGLAVIEGIDDREHAVVRAVAWMCASLGILMGIAPGVLPALPLRLHHYGMNAAETALAYERRHPGRAWFPCNPLAHLLASGRAVHVDYSVYDREIGGFPLSPRQFETGLPPGFELVAIPPGEGLQSAASHEMLQHFERSSDTELPGWEVYRRLP